MTTVKAAPPDGIRVLACLSFAPRAPFDQVAALKNEIIACEHVLHSVEVAGAFDLMFEIRCQDLEAYQAMLDDFAGRYRHLVERYEANFVCRRFIQKNEPKPRWFWVPCPSGKQRIDHILIDKITAEGDYVRLHSGSNTWLLHSTMKKVFEQLDPDRFLQISRSLIVRTDFISHLLHDSRSWQIRLSDGSEHRVSQSHCSEVISAVKMESSAIGAAAIDATSKRREPAGETHPLRS